MKRIIRAALIFAAAAFVGAAQAGTPNSVDHTDLWWNASESGWGLSLFQQGDVMFGTLFVYGPDGKGTWFAVSGLRSAAFTSGNPTWTGPLYRTRGPAFTNPEFDPASVVATQVGELSAEFRSPYEATIRYNVGDARVVKQVTRQTWRFERVGARLQGGISAAPKSCAAGVPQSTLDVIGQWRIEHPTNATIKMSVLGGCEMSGDYERQGRLGRISNGTLTCPSATGPSYRGSFTVEELETNQAGASGWIRVADPYCTYEGSFGGHHAELSAGDDDNFIGMWWNPRESGYGVGVHSQGQSAFLTLYTYGVDREPVFFVAPGVGFRFGYFNLPPPKPPLYRTEGSYFAAPFNPAATKTVVAGHVEDPDVSAAGIYSLSALIEGTRFTDSLQRQTFAPPSSLAGRYHGGFTGAVLVSRCEHPNYEGKMTVDQTGDRVKIAVAFVGASGTTGNCTFNAVARPDGQRMSLEDGTYACDANDGGAAHGGRFFAYAIEVKQHGFNGSFAAFDAADCVWASFFGGVRAAN